MSDARRAAIMLGVILIAAGALFGIGYEMNVVGEGNAARDRMRRAGSSATPQQIASESYHMAHGEAAARTRWSLLGHGTLSVAAAVLGAGLIAFGVRAPGSRTT